MKEQNETINKVTFADRPNDYGAGDQVETFVTQSRPRVTPRRPSSRRGGVCIPAALLGIGLGVLVGATAAQTSKTQTHEQHLTFPIPEAIRTEHSEIHNQLVAATKVQGQVGETARKLAAILDPHFQREEQIALPPLALLAPLSRGEFTPEMRDILVMTDALRAELPHMLEEHKAIHAATAQMGAAAKGEGNAAVERLAETLRVHAQSEEEILYPAAVLVGDLVRAHLASKPDNP
ncbi:MAG: hemerythrin domain-containing protein [Chthoniobacterales bacterium]